MKLARLIAVALSLLLPSVAFGQIERIWIGSSAIPQGLVVCWTSASPGPSIVEYGPTEALGTKVWSDGPTRLHQVVIPLFPIEPLERWFYRVRTGDQVSEIASFKAYPEDELRVAIVADWQGKPDLSSLQKDDPHLLLTAGDNVPDLHSLCGAGGADCTKPYEALIDRYSELFRSTPFLPALGNHDREIRLRGKEPPSEPVYDVEATAFRRFFALPGDEWKWRFDPPGFDLRFVALDLNHISDFGTTWQTCHDFREGSEQLAWYRSLMEEESPSFVVTLYNERNASVRSQAGGAWGDAIRRGTFAVSGFGYFAERAEVDGFPYYNTSLSGKGTKYPDPQSKFLASEDSYLLLTAKKDPPLLTVEIKSLAGETLDKKRYAPR
ncbi:MAG TPA: metallophosphoesterase [Pirellulaceae bacterium]|jgi:hypothetical protein|nr:metallophosphoesterase [Pirellulaceae bacterium]